MHVILEHKLLLQNTCGDQLSFSFVGWSFSASISLWRLRKTKPAVTWATGNLKWQDDVLHEGNHAKCSKCISYWGRQISGANGGDYQVKPQFPYLIGSILSWFGMDEYVLCASGLSQMGDYFQLKQMYKVLFCWLLRMLSNLYICFNWK